MRPRHPPHPTPVPGSATGPAAVGAAYLRPLNGPGIPANRDLVRDNASGPAPGGALAPGV
jgi:hypothetical protein